MELHICFKGAILVLLFLVNGVKAQDINAKMEFDVNYPEGNCFVLKNKVIKIRPYIGKIIKSKSLTDSKSKWLKGKFDFSINSNVIEFNNELLFTTHESKTGKLAQPYFDMDIKLITSTHKFKPSRPIFLINAKENIGSMRLVGMAKLSTDIPFKSYLLASENEENLLVKSVKEDLYNSLSAGINPNMNKDFEESKELQWFNILNKSYKVVSSGSYDFGIKRKHVTKRLHFITNSGKGVLAIKHRQVYVGKGNAWKIALINGTKSDEINFSLSNYNITNSKIQIVDDKLIITGLATRLENRKCIVGVFRGEIDLINNKILKKDIIKLEESSSIEIHKDSSFAKLYYQSTSVSSKDGYAYFLVRQATNYDYSRKMLGKVHVLTLSPDNKLKSKVISTPVLVSPTSNLELVSLDDGRVVMFYTGYKNNNAPEIKISNKDFSWEKTMRKHVNIIKHSVSNVKYKVVESGEVLKSGAILDVPRREKSYTSIINNIYLMDDNSIRFFGPAQSKNILNSTKLNNKTAFYNIKL